MMNVVNAISKVRFASAKPQRVLLRQQGHMVAELLCLESGQEMTVESGQWSYYIVTSRATFNSNGQSHELGTGHFASSADGESHKIINNTDQRLICLAVGKAA